MDATHSSARGPVPAFAAANAQVGVGEWVGGIYWAGLWDCRVRLRCPFHSFSVWQPTNKDRGGFPGPPRPPHSVSGLVC